MATPSLSPIHWIQHYTHWLHAKWPAGKVEKLPEVKEDGSTNVSGLYVVGDLTGIPLLKFSSDTGARVIQTMIAKGEVQPGGTTSDGDEKVDVAIIGAGVSGMAAAIEAKQKGLSFKLFEAQQAFATIANFPKGKPIFTYPTDMVPAGEVQFKTDIKEDLLDEMIGYQEKHEIELISERVETVDKKGGEFILSRGAAKRGEKGETVCQAKTVVVAIGRSGNFRKLGVPWEQLDKVYNRLHDPKEFCGKNVLVVGGGDSAMEAAIALGACGAKVTLSYRKPEFSRPKPENVEKLQALAENPESPVAIDSPTSERVTTAASSEMRGDKPAGSVVLEMASKIKEIHKNEVEIIDSEGAEKKLLNDAVFSMIGREAPLDFFRRAGVRITGERGASFWWSFASIVLIFAFLYQWKKPGTFIPIAEWLNDIGFFPFQVPEWWASLGGAFTDPTTIPGTLSYVVGDPGFYYSILYCVVMLVFGIRRIQRRKTPYVRNQTLTLLAFQWIPLFFLPYLILPWMGFNGWFDSGALKSIADSLFPEVTYGSGREYWRAFGLILAWPLFIWNLFTDQPLWGWLVISMVQTFVIIPLIVWRWGKGAYCGWVCSCGGMAETLGDTHRHKMPHGPFWNRLNMIGQGFLAFAMLLLIARMISWAIPGDDFFDQVFHFGLKGGDQLMPWSYAWFVDLLFAGIIGFGFYFHFSGRVWCRFACPLAALMHIYARFTRFRIFADKNKCISCNVCTSVCHQGIDIMNFANKGQGMEDPECVRCSACVQSCPTGVLTFGHLGSDGTKYFDQLPASPVQIAEKASEKEKAEKEESIKSS
ncbi:MAG: NAD(P)-binding domain-containing protein [Verrucomicrobiota bacterium]